MNTFTNYLIDRKQGAISEFSKHDKEYNELNAEVAKKGLNLAGLLNGEGLHIFENFKEDLHLLNDIQSDMLYLQGYKDCIQLLKLIDAF